MAAWAHPITAKEYYAGAYDPGHVMPLTATSQTYAVEEMYIPPEHEGFARELKRMGYSLEQPYNRLGWRLLIWNPRQREQVERMYKDWRHPIYAHNTFNPNEIPQKQFQGTEYHGIYYDECSLPKHVCAKLVAHKNRTVEFKEALLDYYKQLAPDLVKREQKKCSSLDCVLASVIISKKLKK